MEIVGNPPNPASDKSHRVATSNDIEVSTYLEIAEQNSGQKSLPAEEPPKEAEREAIVIID